MWSPNSGKSRCLRFGACVLILLAPLRGLPTVPEGSRPAYRFVPGERRIFHINYAGTSNFDLRVLFPDHQAPGAQPPGQPLTLATSLAASLRADLAVTVLEKTRAGFLASYTFRDPVVQMLSRGQEIGQSLSIRKDLSRDILVRLNPQGKVVAVWFDRGIEGLSRDFALTLLALTQFVLPSGADSATDAWTSQEENRTGRYLARYRAVAPADATAKPGVFRKTIAHYLPEREEPVLPGRFQTPKKVKPGGSLAARFDLAAGHLLSLSGSETEVTQISGKTVARTETTFAMTYVGMETLNATELTELRETAATQERSVRSISLYVKRSKAEMESSVQRSELGKATLEDLLADLAKAEAAQETNETPLYLKFKALVYVHPEACDQLGKLLATAPPKSLTMRIVSSALGAVGHAEAQAALIEAINARPNDWPALSTLIPALSGAGPPTRETERVLRGLAASSTDSNVASTATLALGTLAHNLGRTSSERATNIVNWLIGRVETSSSEEQTRLLLLALGNAGTVSSLRVLTRFTTNSSPALRGAAVAALRFIRSPRADHLLVRVLASDTDPQVRGQAVYALSFRAMTSETFAAQKKALTSDQDSKVRVALLKNLWKAGSRFPGARQLVEQSSQNDAAEEVRKAAATLLQGSSSDVAQPAVQPRQHTGSRTRYTPPRKEFVDLAAFFPPPRQPSGRMTGTFSCFRPDKE